jgi:integrase/recombinase XerD
MQSHTPSINLKFKTKVEGKWTFVPVAKAGEKYVPDRVLIQGKPIKAPKGSYYIEWWEQGKRRQKSVGHNWRHATEAVRIQTHVLALRAEGAEVQDAPQLASQGQTISEAAREYLATISLSRKSRSKYASAIGKFLKFTSVSHVAAVNRNEIIAFMRNMEHDKGLAAKTIVDETTIVLSFLRRYGNAIRMERGDWPAVVERKPRLYQTVPMKRLFEYARKEDQELYELLQTFRLTGFREQELGFASWDDFDSQHKTLSVTAKPDMGFQPKNYQERTVEIPDVLVSLLIERRKRYPESYLIFPTSEHNKARGMAGGKRDRHMLDKLKRFALRHKLNCGRCQGTYLGKATSCAKSPICHQWGLHKFRHTYATTLVRDGVDLPTLQRLLGHKDMDSTKKYLYAAMEAEAHAKISETRLASLEIT